MFCCGLKKMSKNKKGKRKVDDKRRYKQATLYDYGEQKRTGNQREREQDEKYHCHRQFINRDTDEYRNGYPGKGDNPDLNDNLMFYKGEIESAPEGAFIDEIHEEWWGKYDLLESHHGYIQWLFPIRESGMNCRAQPLQPHEAKEIKADHQASKRVLRSYKMMLDFYGMRLENQKTGRLERSENWKKRFHNLNQSSHNYLRITRILKCLGELGFEHLKKSFIQFILHEALIERTLVQTMTSCRDYWIETIRNDRDREQLYSFIDAHQPGKN